MSVLCAGMAVCDIVISCVPSDIMRRDSCSIERPVTSCGGDALNVAVGLAKLGERSGIAARIGDDANGRFILNLCRETGVDASGLIFDSGCATATTFALVDERGERHFCTDKSIFSRLKSGDVGDELIGAADTVYFGSAMALPGMNDGDGLADLFKRAKRAGKLTVLDAAEDSDNPETNWLRRLEDAFYGTDVFLPSLAEARLITGKQDHSDIADNFRRFGMKAFGIKLGERGCYITDFKQERYVDALRGVPVVDTTGAGDSFVAGYICALNRGLDWFEAAQFASCVAGLSVGGKGSTAGIPSFDRAYRLYRERY